MSESYESLRRLFSDAGYGFVEPALLYEASVFVDLAGEDLRRRLYLTSAADGTEMALRPDYTIPVCLHHLATGAAKRRADYAYLGRVFRQRQDEPGEFFQAGVESLGRSDRAAADADLLKLALAAVDLLGVKRPTVRIGDSALFAAVLDGLDVSLPWRRRLARAFGDTARLNALLKRLADGGDELPAREGALAGLDPADERGVRRVVEVLLAETGLATVGGRGAEEIAARFVEKVALAEGDRRAPRVLGKFLKIAGEPGKAAAAMGKLALAEGLAIGKAIDLFERRADGFAAHGIELRRLAFAADFGRRLDYYTGFVFEIYDRPDAPQIVGGGRYDKLLGLISRPGARSAGEPVPAVGFSIWLDRVASFSSSSGGAKRRPQDPLAQRRDPTGSGARVDGGPPVKPGDDVVESGARGRKAR